MRKDGHGNSGQVFDLITVGLKISLTLSRVSSSINQKCVPHRGQSVPHRALKHARVSSMLRFMGKPPKASPPTTDPTTTASQRRRERDAQVMKAFGELLLNEREHLGLSMGDFAFRIGITVDLYAKLERGERSVPLGLLMRIAAARGYSAETLVSLLLQKMNDGG